MAWAKQLGFSKHSPIPTAQLVKLSKEKTFVNFVVWVPPVEVFSMKFGNAAPTYTQYLASQMLIMITSYSSRKALSLKVSCYIIMVFPLHCSLHSCTARQQPPDRLVLSLNIWNYKFFHKHLKGMCMQWNRNPIHGKGSKMPHPSWWMTRTSLVFKHNWRIEL